MASRDKIFFLLLFLDNQADNNRMMIQTNGLRKYPMILVNRNTK
jgi:hypothetical protein